MAALSRERWHQLAPHLDRALELSEPERGALLASLRAQDPRLVAELQSLLDEHQRV